jgi:hypothetical protein
VVKKAAPAPVVKKAEKPHRHVAKAAARHKKARKVAKRAGTRIRVYDASGSLINP